MTQSICVIGAGVAGLTCARELRAAGHSVVIWDKGRGVGGRCATRRAEGGLQFDHGAQYVTAKSEAFQAVLSEAAEAGAVATWPGHPSKTRWVGTPGMSALAKYLAHGLDVTQSRHVTAVQETYDTVTVHVGEEAEVFDLVVSTLPAPQMIPLIADDADLTAALGRVTYDPCLTLMAALELPRPDLPDSQREPEEALSWLARDTSKPGRPGQAESWVAHASPEWSARHLELEMDEIAQALTAEFCARLGIDRAALIHAVAHRWRYAAVRNALGRDFAQSRGGRIYCGGDWCLAARVEAAFESGLAIARHILAAEP
ncbi:MAG: FAD-dependent oxidoreductase [Pseudomonadota bacterium]